MCYVPSRCNSNATLPSEPKHQGSCIMAAIWRCRTPSSQWQRSLQWKPSSHLLQSLAAASYKAWNQTLMCYSVGDYKLFRGYPGDYDGYHADGYVKHSYETDPCNVNDLPDEDFDLEEGWSHYEVYAKKAEGCILLFNVVGKWPSDAIWRHRFRSTLVEIMTCYLSAPNLCVNRCRPIISEVSWHSPEDSFKGNLQDI